MKKLTDLIALCACILVSGCGASGGFLKGMDNSNIHSYTMTTTTPPRFIRTVSGSSHEDYLFCLIPVEGGPLYQQAMKGLHDNANLSSFQILDNVREDEEATTYLVACTKKLTISADIYDLSPLPSSPEKAPSDRKLEGWDSLSK